MCRLDFHQVRSQSWHEEKTFTSTQYICSLLLKKAFNSHKSPYDAALHWLVFFFAADQFRYYTFYFVKT
jgi:hypothetical protein